VAGRPRRLEAVPEHGSRSAVGAPASRERARVCWVDRAKDCASVKFGAPLVRWRAERRENDAPHAGHRARPTLMLGLLPRVRIHFANDLARKASAVSGRMSSGRSATIGNRRSSGDCRGHASPRSLRRPPLRLRRQGEGQGEDPVLGPLRVRRYLKRLEKGNCRSDSSRRGSSESYGTLASSRPSLKSMSAALALSRWHRTSRSSRERRG
jgi:hypothetical protein